MRSARKHKTKERRDTHNLKRWISTVIVGIMAAALAIVLVISLKARLQSTGAYRSEYVGRVENKWVTYHETQFGTRVSRHLLIKAKDGAVFQVVVDPEFYHRTKVDEWVIKDKQGLRRLDHEPE